MKEFLEIINQKHKRMRQLRELIKTYETEIEMMNNELSTLLQELLELAKHLSK